MSRSDVILSARRISADKTPARASLFLSIEPRRIGTSALPGLGFSDFDRKRLFGSSLF